MRVKGFGELEAVVMDRIWECEGTTTTVRQIFDGLAAHRDIAYSTVMSTMDNLYRKGWLERVRTGKAFTYWPTLSREQHTARLMREVFDAGGQTDLVLTHFVEQMSAEESASLRQALRRLSAEEDTA